MPPKRKSQDEISSGSESEVVIIQRPSAAVLLPEVMRNIVCLYLFPANNHLLGVHVLPSDELTSRAQQRLELIEYFMLWRIGNAQIKTRGKP